MRQNNLKEITIIGCGASGQSTAAYFALSGYAVTLCDTEKTSEHTMDLIRKRGGILLRGNSGKTGLGTPARLTHDFKAALSGTYRVILCLGADRHEELAKLCAPYVNKDSCLILSPGNLGSVFFYREISAIHGENHAYIAEMSGNLWACRSTGEAETIAALPLKPKQIAGYPYSSTGKVMEAFGDILELIAGQNVIETTLNSPNVVSHVSGVIPNASKIEQMKQDFVLMRDGLTPAVLKCGEAVEEERNLVLRGLKLDIYGPIMTISRRLYENANIPELSLFRSLDGPSGLFHRYMEEDASCGMALLVSLAGLLEIPVPVSKSLLLLAGCLNGKDYLQTGRTLQNMGWGSLDAAGLLKALR
jgi:hypothetical protein